MSLQQKLITMLSDSFQVQRVGADDFTVKPDGLNPIRLHASEQDLADFAVSHAADGLLALGDVDGDTSGTTAAIGLLSVHVTEAIVASDDERAADLAIRGDGLVVCRERSADG